MLLQLLKDNDAIRRLYYRYKLYRGAKAQSDEDLIIEKLTADAPRTFVEFGFHPAQFNCSSLASKPEWKGLLIDGNGNRSRMQRCCCQAESRSWRRS